MTLEEFKENVDGAPYEVDKVAYLMSQITNDVSIKIIGEKYMQAEDDLFSALEELGIELG